MTNTSGYIVDSFDYDGEVVVVHNVKGCGANVTKPTYGLEVTVLVDAIHAHSMACKQHGQKGGS